MNTIRATDKKLENVFWLGGSPCSGKSSISQILENRFDINVYRVDVGFESHWTKFNSTLHPTLCNWENSTWNERWMQPVSNLVENVIKCYREHFSLVLEDIQLLPKDKPLLVEGTALLPKEVFDLLSKRSNAIWIVPNPEFQKEKYAQREWVSDILKHCDEPEKAFQNWMERDIKFADWIVNQAKKLNLDLLFVDGKKTIEENAVIVAEHFQF